MSIRAWRCSSCAETLADHAATAPKKAPAPARTAESDLDDDAWSVRAVWWGLVEAATFMGSL